MEDFMNKYQNTLEGLEQPTWKRDIALVIEGGLIGILAGLTAVAYRFCLTWAEAGLYQILETIEGNLPAILLWFAALAALGCLTARAVRFEPMSSGSGIPQVSGEVKGYLDPVWWRVILAKFIGGTASIFSGLSLGREGPSIQLGAMAAKGYSRARGYDKTKEIGLLSCGAGAGLAAAFNAPLAGIMFVLEEIHHTFDRTMLIAGLAATISADYVSKIFFGQAAIFSFSTSTLALRYYWLLVLLGVLLGIAGAGYNIVMMKTQKLFQHMKHIPGEIRFCLVFIVSGALGLILPQVLAGGHSMITLLEHQSPALAMLILLLAAKFLFSAVSFGSGAPGGIFFPLLILGAYIGAIFGKLSMSTFPLPEDLIPQFIVLGMAGLFAGIVRAPITGIVLITEMTGNMHRMLDIAVVSILAYLVANLLGSRPIYSSLLDNILRQRRPLEIEDSAEKVLGTYVVPFDSPVCHKKIRQINWQKNTLVASIYREGHTITPKGDTEILPADQLMVLIGRQYYAADNAAYEALIYGDACQTERTKKAPHK